MVIYPVIDIKSGNCVRTKQGKYMEMEVYSHFPEKVAKNWELQGAEFLHIIDLDGAMVGHFMNYDIIAEIMKVVNIPIEVGGGIRTVQEIEKLLQLGVSRVVIGTKAAKSPAFVREIVNIFGAERIVISIDTKNGSVMMDAWENVSDYSATSLARKMKESGIKHIIFTDVERDGMLEGANIEYAKEMIQSSGLNVIVSGGVSSLKDLELLKEIGAKGAILGKALYEHKINLKTAIEIFQIKR